MARLGTSQDHERCRPAYQQAVDDHSQCEGSASADQSRVIRFLVCIMSHPPSIHSSQHGGTLGSAEVHRPHAGATHEFVHGTCEGRAAAGGYRIVRVGAQQEEGEEKRTHLEEE